MDKKKLMLLMGALVVAIGTALAARSMFTGASAPSVQAVQPQAPQGPKVLVAQRALPVGTIITADSINFQAWPKDMVQDAYFVDGEANMTKLLGTVVRYPITAGQPVTQGALVAPGDRGFLAAALGPGMRAVTISVSDKTGVAGFIFPGDRVDLMLTQAVKGEGEGDSLKATETILRNLRILATDQATQTETAEGKTVVKVSRTVTLEVTPRIAEKIQVAQTIGTLSLSLRSIADNQSELEKAIATGAVKVPTGATKEEEDRILNQAMNRPIEGETSYVTGADVSRFQRRSVPSTRQDAAKAIATSFASAIGAAVGGRMGPPVPAGPVVRVTRGKTTTEEAAGGK
ncbi:MAG: Flp pilus assembly protein CpaB [Sphingomonadales bacterium]|nr:Flp pilus assembly protein CpaB [Sphingomonadales bacterium]